MEIKRVILTIETIETTTITISEQGVTPDEKSSHFVFVAVQHDVWRGVWRPAGRGRPRGGEWTGGGEQPGDQ